jgi:hypothetical protein
MVPVPYVLDISGTETWLHIAQTRIGRLLLAGEIGLQRRHPGVDEEERGIIGGDQAGTRNASMIIFLKELEEGLADLVACHFHGHR